MEILKISQTHNDMAESRKRLSEQGKWLKVINHYVSTMTVVMDKVGGDRHCTPRAPKWGPPPGGWL